MGFVLYIELKILDIWLLSGKVTLTISSWRMIKCNIAMKLKSREIIKMQSCMNDR